MTEVIKACAGQHSDCALQHVGGDDGKTGGANDACGLEPRLREVTVRRPDDLVNAREFVPKLRLISERQLIFTPALVASVDVTKSRLAAVGTFVTP